MERVAVVSSDLKSVGYDPDTLTLEVEFRTGAICEYANVPAHVHGALMSAVSKGHFFSAHIRDVYPHRQLN